MTGNGMQSCMLLPFFIKPLNKMKTLQFTITLIAFAMLIACSNQAKKENEALKAEIEMLAEENALLAEGTMDMAHTIDSYHEALKEIDQQIAAIDEKKQLVQTRTPEFKSDAAVEEDILAHIDHIHHMMENSKHKINHLNNSIAELQKAEDADHERIHFLEEELYDMAGMVVARDTEIDAMHDMLAAQGFAIVTLADAYNEQLAYSEVLMDILNTGFFVAATKKELKEMGILDMEGGFMGIGRVKTLNANAPAQFLTPIDIRETDIIELAGKKATLITNHPQDSYDITFSEEKDLVFLGVANKLKFWQETNYLVIEIID
jgi:hypothetical protein